MSNINFYLLLHFSPTTSIQTTSSVPKPELMTNYLSLPVELWTAIFFQLFQIILDYELRIILKWIYLAFLPLPFWRFPREPRYNIDFSRIIYLISQRQLNIISITVCILWHLASVAPIYDMLLFVNSSTKSWSLLSNTLTININNWHRNGYYTHDLHLFADDKDTGRAMHLLYLIGSCPRLKSVTIGTHSLLHLTCNNTFSKFWLFQQSALWLMCPVTIWSFAPITKFLVACITLLRWNNNRIYPEMF